MIESGYFERPSGVTTSNCVCGFFIEACGLLGGFVDSELDLRLS